MSTQDRKALSAEKPSGFRALDERRIDPGTMRRENIDPPSKLTTIIPRGRNNTGMPSKIPVKR